MGEILIDITPEQWEALKKSETITLETKNPIPVESGSEVICYILNTGIVGKFEVKDAGNYSAMYDTAAEALEDARNEIEYMIESRKKGYKVILPERVFVGECELYRPSLLSCGYDVIESVQADAYDEGGEYAENYLDDVTKEQREELEEQLDVVFNAWLEKYDLYPNFYTIPAHETYKYIDGKFEREEE